MHPALPCILQSEPAKSIDYILYNAIEGPVSQAAGLLLAVSCQSSVTDASALDTESLPLSCNSHILPATHLILLTLLCICFESASDCRMFEHVSTCSAATSADWVSNSCKLGLHCSHLPLWHTRLTHTLPSMHNRLEQQRGAQCAPPIGLLSTVHTAARACGTVLRGEVCSEVCSSEPSQSMHHRLSPMKAATSAAGMFGPTLQVLIVSAQLQQE